MVRLRTRRTSLLSLCLAVSATPLLASTVSYRTDEQLIALSERVVHARAVAQRTTWAGPNLDRIYTVTTLEILEDLTGRPGDQIEVWEMGGVIGDSAEFVGGQVRYQIGREVLVCLRRGPYGFQSVAMGFSKFDVRRTDTGDAQLVRNGRDMLVVGAPVRVPERTLDEFRRLAEQVTGRPSRRVRQIEPVQNLDVQAEFTFLGNGDGCKTPPGMLPCFRWAEADTATPVSWRRNLTASSPLTSGNIDTEIGVAVAAWTNPPSASLILQFAGTTNQANPKSGFTGGVITFEDPNGEIDDPVLAIGGGGCSACTNSMASGGTFFNFTRGYVIFDNAATLDDAFQTPPNFTRVLTHEIGHAIGLGHADESNPPLVNPDENIMNSSCCSVDTPLPPAIGPDDLAGLNFIYPATPTGPQMSLDKTSLRFGGVVSGAAFSAQTSAQLVRLTQTGAGMVTWTATSTQPWLQVSPASGSGSATLSIGVVFVGSLPPSGAVGGSISLVFTGAGNSPGPVSVTLTIMPFGMSVPSFGVVDTPTNFLTGVAGAVPFTGWALDDVEVAQVSICRAAVAGEVAPVDANCGSTAKIFLGFAVFIDGARPDVQAGFPGFPRNSRAGWGFMVLTNMLPDVGLGMPTGGNGTYEFSMYARDREGMSTLLGVRTMTCTNATAQKPWGAIDTPDQGGTASGTSFVNFGWALTQQGKFIPFDGSTIRVQIDSVDVGTADYNHPRSDIAMFFPGYANSVGPVGFRIIDTTLMTNGLHTIVWVVTDSGGFVEGIGSRFFTVSNGVGSVTAAAEGAMVRSSARAVPIADAIAAAPQDDAPVLAQRGWDATSAWWPFGVGRSGRTVIRSEEINRVEVWLGPHVGERYTGHLRVGDTLAALPIGSTLDAETGTFAWAPVAGFVGNYDLVFVRWVGEDAVARHELRVILAPKGSGHLATQIAIDAPRPQQQVDQPFLVTGWAADLDAPVGTGIDTLHAWAIPSTGGPPIFLGTPALGGIRPDVAAVHGDRYYAAGFALTVQGLPRGTYDLSVFPWSNVTGSFAPPKTIQITVR